MESMAMTTTPESILDAVDADLGAERYAQASEKITSLGPLTALPPALWGRAVLRSLRCRLLAGEPVDRIAIDARAELARAEDPKVRARLHTEIAYSFVAKRCEALAREEVELARVAWPEGSVWATALSWVALRFDHRDEALARAEEGTTLEEPESAQMLLARVHYVCGRFDAALSTLGSLVDAPRHRVAALRLRADVDRVRGDWQGFLDHVARILELTPGGAHRRRDQLDRASALFALGRREEGAEVYRALWREHADDGEGRFAREVLNHLERGAAGERKRVMLPAFPTVQQKRNYCGPASLELVLRSLGIDVDQDRIAPEVKGDRGSTLHAMTTYLESHGLVTRRFEGDASRFRACLELGLPVIVEEEYSTTSHVAVMIGVDEELGLLFVQDPMTHVTSERLVHTQGSLGKLYRNAAIVAFRANDEKVIAALDAAGVKDAEHIRIIDSCATPEVEKDPEEILRRCDRAIALERDYPLAWNRRTHALFRHFAQYRAQTNLARFLAALREARVRYHDQEWPHQIHGWYLMDEGRWEEALIELEEALRLDPGDSNNAQDIAECHMSMKRRADADAAFWKTLTIDPTRGRATENFASHALEGGDFELAEHLSRCARVMAPNNPFNWMTASKIAEKLGKRDEAITLGRKCMEISPRYTYGAIHLAQMLSSDRDDAVRDEALEIVSRLSREAPLWFEPRWRAAQMLEERGRIEEAVDLLVAGLEIAQDEPVDLLRTLTAILHDAGDTEREVEYAERFAMARPTVGMLGVLFDVLERADRHPRLLEVLHDFHAQSPDSPYACAQLAARIVGQDDEDAQAIALFEKAVQGSPTYAWARRCLATLKGRDDVESAIALLAKAPGAKDAYVELDRAAQLVEARRWDEASDVLAPFEAQLGWSGRELRNRIVLRDRDAKDALEPSSSELRAQLAIAGSLGRFDVVREIDARLSEDDASARTILIASTDGWDELRPLLDARLARLMGDPRASYYDRTWAHAVLAGSRAVSGDRGAFDAVLAHERNPKLLVASISTAHHVRHAELVRAAREAIAMLGEDRAETWITRARLRASEGAHEAAIEAARIATERFPHSLAGWSMLAVELLMVDRLDEAQHAARRGVRGWQPWVGEHEAAGLVALVRGDRERAAKHAHAAYSRLVARGFAEDTFPLVVALRAALTGDEARLEWARVQPDLHRDPSAPLWGRLAEIARASRAVG
ncbi:Hypothetical protein I5071_80710 [Sandaracinus amylolyticus]|nr:Hypothetical protein I5071_80710 [Sandaracinus amylolyticus]